MQALPLTDRKGLLQLLIVSILSRHTSFLHRNFTILYLQWVRDGDVERRQGEAPVILLHCDIPGLLARPFNLVLLFDDHRGKAGRPRSVTQDVPDVVVTKQQGGPMVTTNGMVTERIHFGATHLASIGKSGTRKGLTVQRHAQAKLEGRAKLGRLQGETEACNGGREKPVTGVGHRASKHQVAAANGGPCLQLLKQVLMPFRGQELLHRTLWQD